MERFEFDTGKPNANRKNGMTYHGAVEIYPGFQLKNYCSLDIRGPAGAYRGSAIIDKATAAKVGAALLAWAISDNSKLRERLGDLLAATEAVRTAVKSGEGFIPRFIGDFLDNPGGKRAAMNAAIEARKNGEWDHPALMAIGSLTSTSLDIQRIKEFYGVLT